MREVLERARAAREVHDRVDVPAHRHPGRHVALDELETTLALEMRDVLAAAGDEVVEADDVVATTKQRVADVGSDEPGAPRDRDPPHQRPTPVYTKPRRRSAAG